jgi:predicted nucleic acid-binding protein
VAVLDTTFLIDLEKGAEAARGLHEDLRSGTEAVRVPAAVWTEYLSGFPPQDRDAAREALEAGARFEPFTRRLADAAARLQAELVQGGDPLGWHDLQVATTALHYDEHLVSSDGRFEAVPGLAVVEH